VSHYSFDEHTMIPDVLLVGAGCLEAMTPNQRDIVREAAWASYHHMNTLWTSFEAQSRLAIEARGVTFVEPDKAPFIAKAAPLTEMFAGEEFSRNLLKRIAQS
jgi:TRAP-type C4-dicarboxylate transport system substrate-binding protein